MTSAVKLHCLYEAHNVYPITRS